MSITEDMPATATSEQHAAPAQPGGRRNRARTLAVAGLVTAVAAGGVTVAVTLKGKDSAPPMTAPITLPDELAGLTPVSAASDLLKGDSWHAKAKAALGTTPYVAQTYAPQNSRRTVRVVLARTDLTGKLDQVWAVDKGHAVGPDSCTNNVRLAARTQAGIRPTVMVCWRTTPQFSGYTIIIDPLAKTPVADTDGAAALDAAWKAADGPA